MSPRPSSDAESPIPSPNAASCQGCGGNAAVKILRQGTGWRPRWKGREVHGSLRCARAGGGPGQTLPRVSHSATVAFLPPPPPRAPLTALHAGHARWAADLGLAALMSWRGRGWNQRYEDVSILWAPSRVVPEILAAHRHTHGIQSLFWE